MLQLIPQPLFNLGFQPDHLVIDVRLHDTHLARGLIAGGQHAHRDLCVNTCNPNNAACLERRCRAIVGYTQIELDEGLLATT